MLIKCKFKCEKCDAVIVLEGAAQYGGYLESLRAQNWKLLVDHGNIRHYCPACKPDDF